MNMILQSQRIVRSCFATVALVVVATSLDAGAAEPAPRRPNILFILTDDQGRGSLGCYGGKDVPTPHIDSLARDGLLFTDAYATPQCTPTRASLLTGQYTARNGMWHVIGWYGYPWAYMAEPPFVEQLSQETFTLPKGLRSAGYATGMAGKWHLTSMRTLDPPAADAHGFDFAVGAPDPTSELGLYDKGVNYLTDQAIGFIERNRERPWFFYLAHTTTHRVIYAPPELVAKYRAAGAPETGRHNAVTLAAVEHLDRSVGRLLAKIDELGLRDETIVVFQSDNGGADAVYDQQDFMNGAGGGLTQLEVETEVFDNRPLRFGKGSAYEGGIRVPCLIRWPKVVKAGERSSTPMHVVDWMPTLLAAAGAGRPKEHVFDGVDLGPQFRGAEPKPRPLFWYMPFYDLRWAATPCAVIRDGDWKLIEYFGDRFDETGRYRQEAALELYNLRDDLGERNNLANADPKRTAELRDRLRTWMAGIPVPVPAPNPHHDPERSFEETRKKQPWNPGPRKP